MSFFAIMPSLKTLNTTSIISNTTLVESNNLIGCDTSGGSAITVTLPPLSNIKNGKIYIIKDEGGVASTNNITITGYNEDTIDGSSKIIMTVNYSNIIIYGRKNYGWFVLCTYPLPIS
jgi:hypothetical protein